MSGVSDLAGEERSDVGAQGYRRRRQLGVEPTDELDRRLLALSDEFYGSLLAILREHFADVDGAGPPLRQQAVSRMQDLRKVNGLLLLRKLLPPFTPL